MALITVSSLAQTATSYTHELYGTKDITILSVYIDGSTAGVVYPTSSTWRAAVALSAGENTFSIHGLNGSGNATPILEVTVTLPSSELVQRAHYNPFDEFGALVGLVRLPGEKNLYLQNRIKDSSLYPANASYNGLINAWNRHLGIEVERNAVGFRLNTDSYNRELVSDAYIIVDPAALTLICNAFDITDTLQVDPQSLQVSLTKLPVSVSKELYVKLLDGNMVPSTDYKVDEYEQTVTFLPAYRGEWVEINYNYGEVISTDCTLAELETAVEAFKDTESRSYFLVDINIGDTTLTARGITHCYMYNPPLLLDYTYVRILELENKRYRESFLNDSHFYGTTLQKWARLVNQYANNSWGSARLDESTWAPSNRYDSSDALYHIWDTRPEFWINLAGTIYNGRERLYNGGKDPSTWETLRKKSPGTFKSGVGDRGDLKVTEVVQEQ